MKISLVPPEHINHIWDEVRPKLEPAIARANGRFSSSSVYSAIQRGTDHLWIAFDDEGTIHGAVVTKIAEYPEKRCLLVLFVGGRFMRHWLNDLGDVLNKWARDNQCEAIEGQGRAGWWRALRLHNVRSMGIAFEAGVQ